MKAPVAPLGLRPARPGDAAAIARLWHAGWKDAHEGLVPPSLSVLRDAESFRARTDRWLEGFTLAEVNGALAGFFLLHEDELNQFYVAAPHRGTGLARGLLGAAEAALADSGHERTWLACTLGNDRARRFYERQGWEHAGTVAYHAETSRAPVALRVWRMEKTLNPGC